MEITVLGNSSWWYYGKDSDSRAAKVARITQKKGYVVAPVLDIICSVRLFTNELYIQMSSTSAIKQMLQEVHIQLAYCV